MRTLSWLTFIVTSGLYNVEPSMCSWKSRFLLLLSDRLKALHGSRVCEWTHACFLFLYSCCSGSLLHLCLWKVKSEGGSKGCVSGEVWVSLPADAECELLSAGFDLVLSLHVGHELRAVAVDSQDGVTWTQVTLGSLAARCYLEITFTHTKKKKRKSCY